MENELVVTSREKKERGFIGLGKWEVQAIGCKIGNKAILYNIGNIANVL